MCRFQPYRHVLFTRAFHPRVLVLGFPNNTGRPKNDTPIVTCIGSLSFFDFILVCRPATATLLRICAQGSEGRRFMSWFVLASVTGN